MRTSAPNREQPRTSLYGIKPLFVGLLDPVRVHLDRSGVHPTTITLAAIPVEIAVAGCLLIGTRFSIAFLVVPLLTLVWMGFNALDGSLARTSGRTSTTGAVLNELVDRLGDLVVIAVAFAFTPVAVAAVVAIGILGSELVAAIGWAAVGHRRFAGPMGKPDRAVTLTVGAAIAVVWWPALPIAFGAIGVGSLIGTAVRTRSVISAARAIDTGGDR